MRKSFDGLAAATASLLGQTPTSGHYFVFVSRRRKLLKFFAGRRRLCDLEQTA
jgi:transposase